MAAGAVVLEATTQPAGVLSTVLGSRGDVEQIMYSSSRPAGSARPASAETIAEKAHFVRMRGNEVCKLAVRSMAQSAHEALANIGLTVRDLPRRAIPHQANHRILTATQQSLGLTDEQTFINIDRYGNTGASSIPIALGEFLQSNVVEVGEYLLLVAFGGGLTWGAAVLCWADIAAIKRERRNDRLARTG